MVKVIDQGSWSKVGKIHSWENIYSYAYIFRMRPEFENANCRSACDVRYLWRI